MLLNKTQELDIIRAGTVGNVRIIDHAAADRKTRSSRTSRWSSSSPPCSAPCSPPPSSMCVKHSSAAWRTRRTSNAPALRSTPRFPSPRSRPRWRSARQLQARQEHCILPADHQRPGRPRHRGHAQPAHQPALRDDRGQEQRPDDHWPEPGSRQVLRHHQPAAVVAQSGKRVLLIDADMRKGYLHKVMRCDGDKGLSDILWSHHPVRCHPEDPAEQPPRDHPWPVAAEPVGTADARELLALRQGDQPHVRPGDLRYPADPGGHRRRAGRQPQVPR